MQPWLGRRVSKHHLQKPRARGQKCNGCGKRHATPIFVVGRLERRQVINVCPECRLQTLATLNHGGHIYIDADPNGID